MLLFSFFWAKIFGFRPENPFFAIGPRILSMVHFSPRQDGRCAKKSSPTPLRGHRLPVTALALSARRLDKKDLPHTEQNLLSIACCDFCHQKLVERRQRAEGRSMVWKMATATKRKKSSRGKKRSAFVYFHIISRWYLSEKEKLTTCKHSRVINVLHKFYYYICEILKLSV